MGPVTYVVEDRVVSLVSGLEPEHQAEAYARWEAQKAAMPEIDEQEAERAFASGFAES